MTTTPRHGQLVPNTEQTQSHVSVSAAEKRSQSKTGRRAKHPGFKVIMMFAYGVFGDVQIHLYGVV